MNDDNKRQMMGAVSSRVRELREGLGLSQSDFADRLGVSRGYVSNIENGKAEPSISLLWQIERTFSGMAPTGADMGSILFGAGHHQGEANAGIIERHRAIDLRALGAALKRADEMERAGDQPTSTAIKALLVKTLIVGYVERYQQMKDAGATADDCHKAAEAEINAAARGIPAE
jgi:transcriptional regulator with XRE-family HTH domain